MVRQRQADLLLIAATVIAACGWIFSREAIAGMPVFAFLGLRFFFAALLLLPFCRGFRPQKQHWPKLIISGLWFALNLCLWIYSVSTTASLGEGAFIMSLSMMFVPLTAWVMMKVRPPRAPVGVPADCGGWPGAAQSAYADSLPPQPGLVFADGAGAVDLVLLHQPLRA